MIFDDVINNDNKNNIIYSLSSLLTTDNFSRHICHNHYSMENLDTDLINSACSAIRHAFDINGDTNIHIGYCCDDALADTVRVSVMVAELSHFYKAH